MKNSLFLFLTLMLFGVGSCKNATETAIKNTESDRKKAGLEDFSTVKLDSIFDIKPISEKMIGVFDKVKNKPDLKSFQVAYYSNKEKNLIKKLYFKHEKNAIFILEEEDKYLKKTDDLTNAFLVQTYDYRKKESSFRIDSLPSEKRIERNKITLNKALEEAKKDNMEICGTAGNKIQKKNFPKHHHFISEQEFRKLKPFWGK